ncbi:hypothetical protein HS088_TW20G00346 [Tripterygium wilfordii]|uniref:S1 motif domain-containing protein n=1 Tax=Tripterygium wilfordii TaxID=458696 RepID=A0A7J7C889_TRIWF|nr:uncharacterized protein LOC119986577 [Tripterygium wilfordii]KAF5729976.1 hypothetical protein HS088_TW20G00346 [Tripterygium wilfordii]
MDGLAIATLKATATATTALFVDRLVRFPSVFVGRRRSGGLSFARKVKKFAVFASKEDAKFDQWEFMELEWGRMRGEDPKLTLAKIMGKKVNPYATDLEIEKEFYKNKGKIVEIEEVPFDELEETKLSSSVDGLNLVRPVPKRGLKFQEEKPVAREIKKPSSLTVNASSSKRSNVPNVILRKPGVFKEDDVEDKSSRSSLRIKPNLKLKMRDEQTNEKFSDMTLLRRPQPKSANMSAVGNKEQSGNMESKVNDALGLKTRTEEENSNFPDVTLLKKPETRKSDLGELSEVENGTVVKEQEQEDNFILGMQPPERNARASALEEASTSEHANSNSVDSSLKVSAEATLHGKPKRLDQSLREISQFRTEKTVLVNSEDKENAVDVENSTSSLALQDTDWKRAEGLLKLGDKEEVELLSSSTRGFIVSFGSLIGFLPYRNLAARWKFLAFETWLRQKGLDPSVYRKSLGVVGGYDVTYENSSPDLSIQPEVHDKVVAELPKDMKLEDLLSIYDQQKLKFLSSFVGQRVKANVVMADRKFSKLIFSMRPKEKDEFIEKKRSLMARLRVGDVVKCCIKKIAYFGIFVEVEGVSALIHQTEVAWDATLDPSSFFRIGQIVEAKVHQLDFALERIFLSLKELTPDPLIDALESVVGDRVPLDGGLVAAEADIEWADVELLIKELQQIKGIESVSKGRFFLSPGLAPTFQVYMASMFENQYKLLARSGNKVQEVMVEASLGKEEMKSAIQSCTNRVG